MVQSRWLSAVTRHEPWDIIIVGGGPAGAIAARQLALQARRVLLVEKSPSPRFKVCGGCLGGDALDILTEVGLGDLPIRLGGIRLRTLRLRCEGAAIELKLEHRVGLSRSALDASLLHEAMLAGATVCAETKGRLMASSDSRLRSAELEHGREKITVRARAILVATGLACCPPDFTTQAGSKSRIGLGALFEPGQLNLEPDVLHMACGDSGYVGIAPVEDGRFDVAAAVEPAALAAARSPGDLMTQILHDAGWPEPPGLNGANWRGTPLLTRQTRPLAAHRCLMIGDAARYVEPFTGEGIGWAMRSAVLASRLAHEGLDVWDPRIAPRWESVYAHSLAGQQCRCRLISQLLLRSKALRRLTVWSLRKAPFLAHSFT